MEFLGPSRAAPRPTSAVQPQAAGAGPAGALGACHDAADDLGSGTGSDLGSDVGLGTGVGDACRGLAALIRRHQGMVWRYLRLLGADPDEADDLMQETFLCAARQRVPLRSPATFLRTVARNLLLGQRRAARRREPTIAWVAAVDELAAAEPHAFDDGRSDALRSCLGRLRGRGRLAVELHHLEGLSYRAAAARLGLSTNGFKSLLDRARNSLRDCVTRRLQGDDR